MLKSVVAVCFSLALAAIMVLFAACGGGTSPKDRINISDDELVIGIGEQYEIAAAAANGAAITWSSSDEDVVTVTDGGIVTGISAGDAVITATAGDAEANCLVTVDPVRMKHGMYLSWSDEFEGDTLDADKWGYQTGVRDVYGQSNGPLYWGNGELQYYTEDAVTVSDGVMTITAEKQAMPDGREYSSARILTRDKFSFTYGYIEAKISMPVGTGMWPAFWLLPQPSDADSTRNEYGGWAASGEIDIVEARGRQPDRTDHTLHYGNSGSSTPSSEHNTFENSDISDWHVYGLEWTESYIAWYVDDVEVYRVNSTTWWSASADKAEKPSAPFDADFYILINLAVGGQYDGNLRPDDDFVSADMKVDYVRVYQ